MKLKSLLLGGTLGLACSFLPVFSETASKSIPMLSPDKFLETVELQDGYYLEAVVTEPHIKEPVDIAFDGNGKMYVLEMRTYMRDADYSNEMEPRSVVSLHQDTNGDGKFDKHTTFAKDLILPRKLILLDGGVVIGETNTHDLYLYKDTDGDGVSDTKTLWYQGGERGGNMEHQPNGFVWGIDNWLYSTYNNYRLRYTRGKVERENIASNQGQWGITQDDYGKIWYVNAGGERGPVHYQSHIEYGHFNAPEGDFEKDTKIVWPIDNIPDVQGGTRRIREDNTLNHYTATCGQEVFRGDRLPEDIRGDLFFSEPVGRLIRRLKISEENGVVKLTHPYQAEKKEFIRSNDPNFRVVNAETAPDGTLYLVDMYRGIIQQGNWTRPGSYLRGVIDEYGLAKNIDHGRIWRLRHKDFDLDKNQPKMLNETPAQLVKHLGHANGWWRTQAQKLIILKADRSVVPTLIKLAKTSKNPMERLHAYWTLEGLDALDAKLAVAMLNDKDKKVAESGLRLAEPFIADKAVEAVYVKAAEGKDKSVMKQAMISLRKAKSATFEPMLSKLSSLPENVDMTWLFTELGKSSPKFRQLVSFSIDDQKRFHKGRQIFQMLCVECHGEDAKGRKTDGGQMGPTLLNSPRVVGPADTIIQIIMNGMTGELDGKTYMAGMMFPNKGQNDEWIASVATYVRNAFGNTASPISPSLVSKIRQESKDRVALWTQNELEKSHSLYLQPDKAWKVSASHNKDHAKYIIDGDVNRRFTSKAKQKKGMWLQVEFPDIQTISGLFMDSATSKDDYARGFDLMVSEDGKTWKKAAYQKVNGAAKTEVLLKKPVNAKSVRLTLNRDDRRRSWSVHELKFYGKKS
jgi:mono/diheme cytochrome c family protein